jgi:hypothetical protein
MAVTRQVITGAALVRAAARTVPRPPGWHAPHEIAAWLPTGQFHRLFPAILLYERPGERRYYIPPGSRVFNYSARGWTSWVTRAGSYKRFLDGRWWNETVLQDRAAGRYYDIATPPLFLARGVAYVDLYLDVAKRHGRTEVVDRDEWNRFLRLHPLAPDVTPLVEYGVREAARFGPVSWRAAVDRMEGECRRWVRDQARAYLARRGITPGPRPVDAETLVDFVRYMQELTGARVAPQRLEHTPSEALGRQWFTMVVGQTAVPRRRRLF